MTLFQILCFFVILTTNLNQFHEIILKKFIKCLTVFRAIKLIRIGRKIERIEKLLVTLKYSFSIISNVIFLVLLILFIYAIFGCQTIKKYYLDDYINFKNIIYGMMTLFKVNTADTWYPIYDVLREKNGT